MGVQYRFLAVDVDGTLLDSQQRLPEPHRNALHQAHEMGMKVCVCTGRSLAEARPVIEAVGLDLDVGVFTFGAIVSELPSGDTLHRTGIREPLAGRLVAYFAESGFPVLALYDPQEAGVDYRYLPGPRRAEAYDRWLEMAPAKVEQIERWETGGVLPVRIGVIVEPDQISATVDLLGREFSPGELKFNSIYAPNYRMHVVECFAPEVNKWYGIQQVASDMGIAASQVVAVGDDVNDLEMIREAGLGVAMGNAAEAIKQIAGWHVPSNDEGGLASVVEAIAGGEVQPRAD
jgi:hydroxymethylpyrimidine pyrophosphatase-like HAD family hydrolase